MDRYFKSVLILFLGFISVEAFSQNAASRLSDAVKFTVKNCKKDCISMQLLKSATQITEVSQVNSKYSVKAVLCA